MSKQSTLRYLPGHKTKARANRSSQARTNLRTARFTGGSRAYDSHDFREKNRELHAAAIFNPAIFGGSVFAPRRRPVVKEQKPFYPQADFNRVQELHRKDLARLASLEGAPGSRTTKVLFRKSKDASVAKTSPQAHLDRLKGLTVKKGYFGKPVGEKLFPFIEKLFETYSVDDLKKDIVIEQRGKGKESFKVRDWFRALFKEEKPDQNLINAMTQLEANLSDMSTSPDEKNALTIKNNYNKGSFMELRAQIALEYLKAAGKIIDYKAIKQYSYLDQLGVDLLVKAKIEGEERVLAIQIKSSNNEKRDNKPKRLTSFNLRRGFDLNTQSQRSGIFKLMVNKKAIPELIKDIDTVIKSDRIRKRFNLKMIVPPKMPEGSNIADRAKLWYEAVEDTFIEPLFEQAKVA